jgi:DNA-binding transcriptional LysR family regulator
VLAPTPPAAQRPVLRLYDLATEPIIVLPSFEDEIDRILARVDVKSNAMTQLDSIDAAKSMVADMLGLALLPLTAVDADLRSGRLVRRDIETVGPLHRQVVALRRNDVGEPTGPCAWFLDPSIVYGNGNQATANGAVLPLASQTSHEGTPS